jgi:hypothetical protein
MFRVWLDGVPIECDSMEEAKRLARSIANDIKGNGGGKTQAAAEKRAEKFLKQAVKILTALKDAGTEGTTGEKLAPLLGLKELKGLGPIAAAMKKRLSAAGLKPETVFGTDRIGGQRRWIAKEKVAEAIKALEG